MFSNIMEYSLDRFKDIIIKNSNKLPKDFFDNNIILNGPVSTLINLKMNLKSYSYGTLIYGNKFVYNGVLYKIIIKLKPNVNCSYNNCETIISIHNKAYINIYHNNSFSMTIESSHNLE